MISVHIAYSTALAQKPICVEFVPELTLEKLLKLPEIDTYLTEDLATLKVGVYGKIMPLSYVLEDNDRVEVYKEVTDELRRLYKEKKKRKK